MDITEVNNEYNRLLENITQAERDVEKAPSGRLIVDAKRNQYYQINNDNNRRKRYLRKDDKKIAIALAQKDYAERFLVAAKREAALLATYLNKGGPAKITDVYSALHPMRKQLVCPYMETDEEYAQSWESVEYESNTFRFGSELYSTARGERVRSKSEVIIADRLHSYEVPYRYEYPWYADGGPATYPDFTVLNKRTRREYIFEHFGLMGDEAYRKKAFEKIERYAACGITLGSGLIATFEDANTPLSTKQLDNIIIANFL